MIIETGQLRDFEIEHEAEDSPKLRRIVKTVLKDALVKFSAKNRGYKSEDSYGLGVRGEFVEINRKVAKLHQGIWNGDESAFASESAEEVFQDLLGHCLLALDYLRHGDGNR